MGTGSLCVRRVSPQPGGLAGTGSLRGVRCSGDLWWARLPLRSGLVTSVGQRSRRGDPRAVVVCIMQALTLS